MSLQHKKIARIGDEYSCAFCGKMWSIDDIDPPTCEAVVAIVSKGVRTMRSGPGPEMQNVPRVAHGNDMTQAQMRDAFYADFSELEQKVAALAMSNPETADEYYDRISLAQKQAFAIASSNPGCSQRVAMMPPALGAPYGHPTIVKGRGPGKTRSMAATSAFAQEYGKKDNTVETYYQDSMYVIGLETPTGWKGAVIYAKAGERAMRYFLGAFGHRFTPQQREAFVLDRVLGSKYHGSLVIPHAEIRTTVLALAAKRNTATGIKYELFSPVNLSKAVNSNE